MRGAEGSPVHGDYVVMGQPYMSGGTGYDTDDPRRDRFTPPTKPVRLFDPVRTNVTHTGCIAIKFSGADYIVYKL